MSRSKEPVRKDLATGRWILTVDIAERGEKQRQYKRRFDSYKEARSELMRIRSEPERGTFVAPEEGDNAGVRRVTADAGSSR